MKKATSKRLPLHRETLVKLQEPNIIHVHGADSNPAGCHNDPLSTHVTC
jgi:hypothetical protein